MRSKATQHNGSGLSAFLQLNGSNPPGQEGSNTNRPALSVGILYNPSSPPSTSVPRAYLRLLAYNSAGEVIRDEPVYVNSQDCLGRLATSSYRVEQDGYVRVYLASESDAPAYFDNLCQLVVLRITIGNVADNNVDLLQQLNQRLKGFL